jgi:hypothetical protein
MVLQDYGVLLWLGLSIMYLFSSGSQDGIWLAFLGITLVLGFDTRTMALYTI